MRKSAEIGRGSHTHIGKPDEVEEQITALWARIENPAIQNICVDWGMEAEFYPEVIPDLYAGEPLWLYARLPREPNDVTICGELDGRYWEMNSRQLPGSGGGNLATLWARSKIEALEDSRIFGVGPGRDPHPDASTWPWSMACLTHYTSLVAVDRTPSRLATEGLESEHIPSLLPAGNGMATGFSKTATGWVVQLLLGLLSPVRRHHNAAVPASPPATPGTDPRSPMTPSSHEDSPSLALCGGAVTAAFFSLLLWRRHCGYLQKPNWPSG